MQLIVLEELRQLFETEKARAGVIARATPARRQETSSPICGCGSGSNRSDTDRVHHRAGPLETFGRRMREQQGEIVAVKTTSHRN
ncbi:hypothetical protein AAGS40_30330 (plasmid) [Paraburkholderia sp. PREW-6R]|uniref:hypothetical protein n=1 Tax=Paraburkholderia sp. PREW-6R TaxID=3141544 RepID=UPI0031F5D1FE